MPSVKRKPIPGNVKMTNRQTDRCRKAIQTSKLVANLQKAALGQVEMSPVALKASQILLDKSLPSLQALAVKQEIQPPALGPHEAEARFMELVQQEVVNLPQDAKQALLQELLHDGTLIEAQPRTDAGDAIDPSPEAGPRTSTAH